MSIENQFCFPRHNIPRYSFVVKSRSRPEHADVRIFPTGGRGPGGSVAEKEKSSGSISGARFLEICGSVGVDQNDDSRCDDGSRWPDPPRSRARESGQHDLFLIFFLSGIVALVIASWEPEVPNFRFFRKLREKTLGIGYRFLTGIVLHICPSTSTSALTNQNPILPLSAKRLALLAALSRFRASSRSALEVSFPR